MDKKLSPASLLAIAAICLALTAVVAALLPGLGTARYSTRGASPVAESVGMDMAARMTADAPMQQEAARQVIRRVWLQLRVAEPQREAGEIASLMDGYNGFVESSDIRETARQGRYTAELVLRVPADRLEEVLAALRDRSQRVLHEQRQADDVTDQHADIEARLRNLRHAEQELRELMTALRQRADDVGPIMQAYRELNNVRERIERYEAQLQRLQQQVALATVRVRLLGPDVPASVADPEWSAGGVASHAAWALVRGLQVLATVAIYAVVTGLPLLLIVLLPLLVATRVIRRRRAADRPGR